MAGTDEALQFASTMRGIEADVVFDDATADTLASVCKLAAQQVIDGAGFRSMWATTALTDFRGHFSRVFRHNAQVAAADAEEVAVRLRELAQGATRLKEEARKEQQRREAARLWKKSFDDRRLIVPQPGDVDWFEPPVGPPAAPPTITVTAAPRPRQTPHPGGGGGARGTSSAIPANLRLFATGSAGLNDGLRPQPVAIANLLETFTALCQWGALDGSGVAIGFARWVLANDEDVAWSAVVAKAFDAAGGAGEVCTVSNSALLASLREHRITLDRTDLQIDPAMAFGSVPTTGYTADPINTGTGNFVEFETDLAFPGSHARLAWTRCYNSFDTDDGAFGRGWSSLADAGLRFGADGARFRLPDGRTLVFPRLGVGWDRAVGDNFWLRTAGPDWLITGNDGSWWRCDASGSLSCFGSGSEDADAVELDRDLDGRLTGARHARGRSLRLVWSGDRVTAVVGSDGRQVDYRYDGHRLLTADTPTGCRSYGWRDDLVTTVTDADGVVEAENVYDETGRVVAQRSTHGRWTRLAYLPNHVTVVSDPDGTRSNTWISDARGRLVGAIDADDARQSMSYDRNGNQVSTTERDGSVTVHVYDDRGRRIRTVTPSGAELAWSHDELDRVTTVSAESSRTAYAYEGRQRNPVTITDPEGGITRLTWRRGLLASIVDPVGVRVDFEYDGFGDLIAARDADGRVARIQYDAAGRAVASITPLGHRTRFGYDDRGHLASRTDPDGAVWRFEHTAAGRLTATVDPLGARTVVERGEHGDEMASHDPLGGTMTRTLDDLGRLISAGLPDGSTWRFAYDALSRLAETVDPTGGRWQNRYDQVGQLTATIDPTGVQRCAVGNAREVRADDGLAQVGVTLDPLGRVTSSVLPDGSAEVVAYDRCGRVVESLDADGGLTRLVRDAAGRVVESISPLGATTRFGYDRCGRLSRVTDPLGAGTSIAYDADGRPVEQVLPTGERAWMRYDACGRVVEHHQPGMGTATYAYDACGRVIETRDPRTGRRRFGYDAAGQLVTITDGNGGLTRYDYDALGRAVAITSPVGSVIRREFDGMNRCVAETDPLDRTTRAGYDAAGRISWQTDPDGHTTSWTYDAAGRPSSMAVDGRTISTLTRDLRNRRLVITDTIDDRPVEHVLEWNRRGQLVRRSRGCRAVAWSYDADGRRTSMTTPDGKTTRYGCDAVGRTIWIEHPDLGRAFFDRDAAGRVVAAVAGGIMQSWRYRDGFVVGHAITDRAGSRRTEIERDESGRVQAVTRDGVRTDYAYDEACQLVAAGENRWTYDAGGRLVTEQCDAESLTHVYDLAGQLLESRSSDGSTVSYSYDGLGRRTHQVDSRGTERSFSWSVTGQLAEIFENSSGRVSRRRMRTDALGELADVDGQELFWDSAAYAGTPVLVGDASVVAGGPVTGIGSDWTAPGWRTARTFGPDPWSGSAESAPGLSVGSAGEVQIAGLEWMGARAYDPASRGLLSTDPLDPVPGAGWSANPYAFAGNDPLHALDPLGLTPVTDADLEAYGSTMNRAGRWIGQNGDYIVGGALIVGGGLLCLTGIGGPLGVMSISAGADVVMQKFTTGRVDWTEAALMGLSGGIGLGVGTVVGGGVRAALGSGLGARILGALSAAVSDGASSSAAAYLLTPGVHTPSGLARVASNGAVSAAAFLAFPTLWKGLQPVSRRLSTIAARFRGESDFMDTHLVDFTPVTYSKTATAIGEDSRTMRNFRRSKGLDGYHDVIVHGDRNGWPSPRPKETFNPGQLVGAIKANPSYREGQPIRLVMCFGRNDAAGVLAQELGVAVQSSSRRVRLNDLGELVEEGDW